MKICIACGCENEEAVSQCQKCGGDQFTAASGSGLFDPAGWRGKNLIIRLAIAFSVWIVVTGISLHVAHRNLANSMGWRIQQFKTQLFLKSVAKTIDEYQRNHGKFPDSLEDVRGNENMSLIPYVDGRYLDGWGNAFAFSSTGGNCVVTSYGRDGKSGGAGLDCDLSTLNWEPPEAVPTLRQFYFEMETRSVMSSCVICGALAYALTLFTVKVSNFRTMDIPVVLIWLGIVCVSACAVAGVIAALHVPSGH
jgi:general secretion pathway protein G